MCKRRLRKERLPMRAYHYPESRNTRPCKILKKLGSNAYVGELPDDLHISPIFNVANLFKFHTFDGNNKQATTKRPDRPITKKA